MLGFGYPIPRDVPPGPEWLSLLAAAVLVAMMIGSLIEAYRIRRRERARVLPRPGAAEERKAA